VEIMEIISTLTPFGILGGRTEVICGKLAWNMIMSLTGTASY